MQWTVCSDMILQCINRAGYMNVINIVYYATVYPLNCTKL